MLNPCQDFSYLPYTVMLLPDTAMAPVINPQRSPRSSRGCFTRLLSGSLLFMLSSLTSIAQFNPCGEDFVCNFSRQLTTSGVPELDNSGVETPGGRPLQVVGRIIATTTFYPISEQKNVPADTIYIKVGDRDDGFDSVVWEGFTNEDGYFDTGIVNWTEGDDPDLYIEIEVRSPAARVRSDVYGDWVFNSEQGPSGIRFTDFEGSFFDFGVWRVSCWSTDCDGAALNPGFVEGGPIIAHNAITRARRWVADEAGLSLPQVEVFWPSGDNNDWFDLGYINDRMYTGIRVADDRAILALYAHHLWANLGLPTLTKNQCPDQRGGDNNFFYCDASCPAGDTADDRRDCPWCPDAPGVAMQAGFAAWFANTLERDFFPERYYQFDSPSDPFEEREPYVARQKIDNFDLNVEEPLLRCDSTEPFGLDQPQNIANMVGAVLRDITDDLEENYDEDLFSDCVTVLPGDVLRAMVNVPSSDFELFLQVLLLETSLTPAKLYAILRNTPGAWRLDQILANDSQPPGIVTNLSSPSHDEDGLNRSRPCLELEWTNFNDDITGGCGYSIQIANDPADLNPDFTSEVQGTCPTTALGALAPGEFWVGIRTRDCTDKWGNDFSIHGPFTVTDCNLNGFPDICDIISANLGGLPCNLPPGFCDGVTPTEQDCNGNFLIDTCEIAAGLVPDCNNNGIPDECEDLYVWQGGSGNWGDPENWIYVPTGENLVPDGPTAVVCGEAGTISVTSTIGRRVKEISFRGNLAITSEGKLTVDEASVVGGFVDINGFRSSLTINDDLVVQGAFHARLNQGLFGTGTLKIEGGFSIQNALTSSLARIEVRSNGEASSFINMTQSGLVLDIAPDATYAVKAGSFISSGGTLSNRGTILVEIDPDLSVSNGSVLQNTGLIKVNTGSVEFRASLFSWLENFGQIRTEPGAEVIISSGLNSFPASSDIRVHNFRFIGGPSGTPVVNGHFEVYDELNFAGGSFEFPAVGVTVPSLGEMVRFDGFGTLVFRPTIGSDFVIPELVLVRGNLDWHSDDRLRIGNFTTRSMVRYANEVIAENMIGYGGMTFREVPLVRVTNSFEMQDRNNVDTEGPGELRIEGTGVLRDRIRFRLGAKLVVAEGASLELASDQLLLSSELAGPFENYGTVIKSASAGVSEIALEFENYGLLSASSGTLRFTNSVTQHAGTTEVNATLAVVTPHTFCVEGGEVVGDGTIESDIENKGGIVKPGGSIGLLDVIGDYLQLVGGKLEIEVASPTSFDRFLVNGNVDLSGEVIVKVMGSFVPAPESVFNVLEATQLTLSQPTLIADALWQMDDLAETARLSRIGTGAPKLLSNLDEGALGPITAEHPEWSASAGATLALTEDMANGNRFIALLDGDGIGEEGSLLNFGDAGVLPSAISAIDDGTVGTVFLRFYVDAAANGPFWLGLTDGPNTGVSAFEGYLRIPVPPLVEVGDGPVLRNTSKVLSPDSWYNLWMVYDNLNDRFELYLHSEERDATASDRLGIGMQTSYAFQNGTTDALTYLQLISQATVGGHRIDDIYFFPGVKLAYPLISRQALRIVADETGFLLIWDFDGTLQRSGNTQSWQDVPGAESPYRVPVSGDRAFYRVIPPDSE